MKLLADGYLQVAGLFIDMKKLILAVSLLALVACSKEPAQNKVESTKSQIVNEPVNNENLNDTKYEKRLNEATQAMQDSEEEHIQKENNPPVYAQISNEQTADFIKRIENTRILDSKINLTSTPEVTRHSREYNALIDEAKAIYGDVNITNDLSYCTNFAETAKELWRLKYSPTSDVEFNKHSIHSLQGSIKIAKQDCLDAVQEKLSGSPSA